MPKRPNWNPIPKQTQKHGALFGLGQKVWDLQMKHDMIDGEMRNQTTREQKDRNLQGNEWKSSIHSWIESWSPRRVKKNTKPTVRIIQQSNHPTPLNCKFEWLSLWVSPWRRKCECCDKRGPSLQWKRGMNQRAEMRRRRFHVRCRNRSWWQKSLTQ